MKLSTNERKSLIMKIEQASGVAQYVLQENLSDTDIIELVTYLDILAKIKAATGLKELQEEINLLQKLADED
jgi:hypothetical protein